MGARSTGSHPTTTKADGHLLEYFRQTFGGGGGGTNAVPPSGHTATGGVISDYTSGSDVYRAHIFTSTGTFDISALGTFGNTVDYLLVAGGGGTAASSSNRAAGSGAGGLLTGTGTLVSVSPYTITVGAGGAGGGSTSNNGVPSTALGQTAYGGGGGGFNDPAPTAAGGNGGSGGGGWYSPGVGGKGVYPGSPYVDAPRQGYDGSPGFGLPEYGGSGGGAGGAGGRGNSGGAGAANVYAYGPTNPVTYAAGGASSDYPSTPRNADGVSGTGNGGSGEGSGGSGIVVVRYKIASITAQAKATGGAVSFYGGKAYHVFNSSMNFIVTDGPISCDFLVVGGGAAGGVGSGGGGGAGGYRSSFPEGPGGPSPSSEGAVTVADGTYGVTIGSGGSRPGNGSTIQALGGSGGFSNIAFPSAIRSEGGGGGGFIGGPGGDGQPGGSGGGANYPNGTRSSGNKQSPHSSTSVPNQGYPGGITNTPANYGAGGGGGAGAAGADGTTSDGGDGGTGKQNTATGVTLSLAGGGGGQVYYPSTTAGDATHGGGQAAPHTQVAPVTGPTSINGHTNTGGGGGGSLRHSGAGPQAGIGPDTPSSNTGQAGQGGSGIVIIAYPT